MDYYFSSDSIKNIDIDYTVSAIGPDEIRVEGPRHCKKIVFLHGRSKSFEEIVHKYLLSDASRTSKVFFTEEACKMISEFAKHNRERYVNYPLTKMSHCVFWFG